MPYHTVTWLSVTRDEVWIGNWIYWTITLVTTNNRDNLTELHTPKVTVTTAHIKSSQSWAVAWQRLPTADVPELSPASATRFSLLITENLKVKVKATLRLTVGQSVSLGVEPHLGLMTRYLLLFDSYGLVFCICRWSSPAQTFSGPSPWISRQYFTVSVLRLPFSSPPTTRRVTVEVFDPASQMNHSL
jgi:hypothetical protein